MRVRTRCNSGWTPAARTTLHPRWRIDRHQSRLPAEVVELLTAIKERSPRLTVKAVMRQARDSGRAPDGVRLAYSTVNRLLRQAGLMERPAAEPNPRDRRRFSWTLASELWTESERSDPCQWDGRYTAPYLQDGRALDIRSTSVAHGGKALNARDLFQGLEQEDQASLIDFLESLRTPDRPNAELLELATE